MGVIRVKASARARSYTRKTGKGTPKQRIDRVHAKIRKQLETAKGERAQTLYRRATRSLDGYLRLARGFK